MSTEDNTTFSKKLGKYLKWLWEYFEKDPATTYFSAFEPILSGMETSYFGPGKLNHESYRCALHTDLSSQLTTDPNWGYLDDEVKQKLASVASGIWNKLVALLEPNLILASFGERHLKWINLPPMDMNRCVEDINTWDTTFEIGEKPYIVNGLLLYADLNQRQKSLFARGYGSLRPFMIEDEYKKELGGQLFRYLKDNGVI